MLMQLAVVMFVLPVALGLGIKWSKSDATQPDTGDRIVALAQTGS